MFNPLRQVDESENKVGWKSASGELNNASSASMLDEASWFAARRKEMDARTARVKEFCSSQPGAHWSKPIRGFMVDKKHKLGFCRQAKVGSEKTDTIQD